MIRTIILTLALLAGPAHAALRPGGTGPTMPTPTVPANPPTGGGSPTLTCVLVPAVRVP